MTNQAKFALFADEIMFIICNENANIATIQLQRQLDSDWFNRWRIKNEWVKTVAVLFGHTANSYNRSFSGPSCDRTYNK